MKNINVTGRLLASISNKTVCRHHWSTTCSIRRRPYAALNVMNGRWFVKFHALMITIVATKPWSFCWFSQPTDSNGGNIATGEQARRRVEDTCTHLQREREERS